MSFKKKYAGKRQPAKNLDREGRIIPSNVELNKDLEEHVNPLETNEISQPFYRLKKYLKYTIKEDDRDIIQKIFTFIYIKF